MTVTSKEAPVIPIRPNDVEDANEPDELSNLVKATFQAIEDESLTQTAVTLERAIEDAQRFKGHADFDDAIALLVGFKQYIDGFVLIATKADYANSIPLFQEAKTFFSKHGMKDEAGACETMELYGQGVVEISKQNLGRGIELLKEAEGRLGSLGPLAALPRQLVDHLAPDQRFVAGVQALANQDFTLAEALFSEAAQKAEYVASTYHTEDGPDRSLCLGQARLYEAYFATMHLWSRISTLDLDNDPRHDEALRAAREAEELLSRTDPDNAPARAVYRLACIISKMLGVLLDAARVLHALLEGAPAPTVDFSRLRELARSAEKQAFALGQQGVALARTCARLVPMLDRLRRYSELRPASAETAGKPVPPIRLFLMLPYNDASSVVEEALLTVLEDDPYWFDVSLARDHMKKGYLFENVKAHMEDVDGYIADVSDLNPNVLFELGMAEGISAGRPMLVLHRNGSAELPSDLKERLYVEYGIEGATPRDKVENLVRALRERLEKVEALTSLRQLRRRRHLSRVYVARRLEEARLMMKEHEILALQKAFPSIEELQLADEAAISARTGFAPKVAEAVARAFRA